MRRFPKLLQNINRTNFNHSSNKVVLIAVVAVVMPGAAEVHGVQTIVALVPDEVGFVVVVKDEVYFRMDPNNNSLCKTTKHPSLINHEVSPRM